MPRNCASARTLRPTLPNAAGPWQKPRAVGARSKLRLLGLIPSRSAIAIVKR